MKAKTMPRTTSSRGRLAKNTSARTLGILFGLSVPHRYSWPILSFLSSPASASSPNRLRAEWTTALGPAVFNVQITSKSTLRLHHFPQSGRVRPRPASQTTGGGMVAELPPRPYTMPAAMPPAIPATSGTQTFGCAINTGRGLTFVSSIDA